jgi:glycosyltransferase involved in cell wall biosynthesis
VWLCRYGVPENATIVLGAAGRLVRDKGHPILFEAISEIVKRHKGVYLLVAGSGPWGHRYDELAPYVKTLGPLAPSQLAEFYNAVDIFVNPTLRAQGLDLTLLEAMQCGKPLLATHFSSIVTSVINNKDFGYTFSPNVDALTTALESVVRDGKDKLQFMGQACLAYASKMFTAEKMALAYERLFLCMTNESFCQYPLPSDMQDCFS